MAFKTYQCGKYIEYLHQHSKTVSDIYKLIQSAPYTKTQLGKAIGVDYYGINRRLRDKLLTYQEMISLLTFIQ